VAALDDWTPVELFKSEDAPDNCLLVPTGAVGLDGATLPKWLLVRVPAVGQKESPIHVAKAKPIEGVADQTAVQANQELLHELGAATDVPYPPASVKRASRRARLRHDRSYQVTTAVTALIFGGGAFGVVEAATGSTWSKVVVAAIAFVAFLGQQIVRN
jgi:hypothetical protein